MIHEGYGGWWYETPDEPFDWEPLAPCLPGVALIVFMVVGWLWQ